MITQHDSTFALEKSPLPFRRLSTMATVGAALFIGGYIVHSVSYPAASTPDRHHSDRHSMNMQMSGPIETTRPQTNIRPVSCEPLPGIPGKSLTVAVIDFPPDAYTPSHRHPGSVSAFVLKGTLRSQMEGSAAANYTAGQTWFEPPGALHLFAENVSKSEPAELLATFITDSNCGPLVIPD